MGRFEELESDSDDQGVDLDHVYKSDEFHFNGGGAGPRRRYKRPSGYDGYSEDSEPDDDVDDGEDSQLALREKEETLVARAMERIRRAQALGKTNVKLTAAESDALERKMAKDRAKGRKPVVATRKVSGSPRNAPRTELVPTNKRKSSKNPLQPSPDTGPPEEYYVPSSSRPSSRSGSSQNLPLQALTRNPKRFVSDPEQPYRPSSTSNTTRRPLPDDPNWQPRPRSSSSANPPYPLTAEEYGNHPVPSVPPQYASTSRRNVSGPAEFRYPDLLSGRQFPIHMPSVRGYAPSSSDPSLPRRREVPSGRRGGASFGSEYEEEDEDEDEDPDQGVQVDVQQSAAPQGYEVSVTKASGGGRGTNASATGSGRARRGRR